MGHIPFFDDWRLISRHNLERRLGKPRYVPEATLEDPLTEGTWNFPMVARLPEGKYVGLYIAACTPPVLDQYRFSFKPRVSVLCYAESDDGMHWRRPDLTSEARFAGPRFAPNHVFGVEGIHDGGPVYYDRHDPDPSRRFKFVFGRAPDLSVHGRLAMAVSPDGIHWELAHSWPDIIASDSPLSVFYHPQRGAYILNGRADGGDRRVFFRETRDWQTFTEPELIMHPDPEDPPLVGFYGMPVYEYEDMWIGLRLNIHADPSTYGLPNGPIDCSLTYSYDGRMFNRAFHRPFVERNELGDHGGGCVYTTCMLVDEHHTIRFYSGGSKGEHFQRQDLTDAALMLHTLRLDGFVYLATQAGRGSLRTRPLRITGDDLRINARSPYAEIRARLLDRAGNPLPGFDYADCEPLVGDELFWSPRWAGGRTFGQAKSDEFRSLELALVSGEVYAIRGDFEIPKSLWSKK